MWGNFPKYHEGKRVPVAAMLENILKERRVPDVDFVLSLYDIVEPETFESSPLPIFSQSKLANDRLMLLPCYGFTEFICV